MSVPIIAVDRKMMQSTIGIIFPARYIFFSFYLFCLKLVISS